MSIIFYHLLRRGLLGTTAITSALAVINFAQRYNDSVKSTGRFPEHTQEEHKKNLLSGMHEALMPTEKDHHYCKQHHPNSHHLLPSHLDTFRQQQALKTPVKIKKISDCPKVLNYENSGTLVVGGVPALMSAAGSIKKDSNVTYINDERRWPIAYGSAWHLEEDAETEAPTTYKPSVFLRTQIYRATVGYVSLASIEKTGLFPWRTLDWMGWIHHPNLWMPGIKLALDFQLAAMAHPEQRQAMLQKLAAQCKANQRFYETLNDEVGGQLLLAGKGSIIVARNEDEVADLLALKENLTKEGRELKLLSKAEMKERYGFVPNGQLYGEKTHDRVLSPNCMTVLKNYIKQHGGKVINGTLTTVYTDHQTPGGVAEYQTPEGQTVFIPFTRLIMSLGSQPILNEKEEPLFDVVAARGVSVLAYAYVPVDFQLPPVMVCGGTNHVTKLDEHAVRVTGKDGRPYDQYLLRMTAGACITPNVSEETSAKYDGSIAVGLIAAVRQTLKDCSIEPFSVIGCNRQVSNEGQIKQINPFPGIYIRYGAGGGGLTRVDYAEQETEESVCSSSPKQ
ncbi:MAG TPA: FAD-dependent oxidoreductase [Legionellaceae bacterium]|nr:FAD-dependent oxidoreductase [Legionellaceae bacterium]